MVVEKELREAPFSFFLFAKTQKKEQNSKWNVTLDSFSSSSFQTHKTKRNAVTLSFLEEHKCARVRKAKGLHTSGDRLVLIVGWIIWRSGGAE